MPISQCVKNICLGIRRLWLPQSCYHPLAGKVLDEAICTGPSPSHDIRPPWRPSVLQKVEVCRGKYNSIHRLLRVELSKAVLQNLSPGLFFQLLEFSASARIAWSLLIHSTCVLPRPLRNWEKWRVWLWVSSTSGVCGQLWWWRVGLVGLGLAP